MSKGYKGKVSYKAGIVSGKKIRSIESQTDAWKEEADCGCGIDCCEGTLVQTDQITGLMSKLYSSGGNLWYQHGEAAPIQITGGGV